MSEQNNIPKYSDEFCSSLKDFTLDLTNTFPEYSDKWVYTESADIQRVFEHCLVVYPERFFDILNQNADIFNETSNVNTNFLPETDFKLLYNSIGVTEQIRETVWKYLQVILFILVNSMKDKVDFGDSMDILEQLKNGDLQKKLEESMKNIEHFFENMETGANAEKKTTSEHMPKMNELHENMQALFDGKIGKLAKELAEDMSADLADSFSADMQGVSSTKDVLSKLMKNPEKIGNVVKSVKEKLTEKMESGDISKDELVKEASNLMKGMGGLGGMEDMMKGMMKNTGNMGDMMKTMMSTMGGMNMGGMNMGGMNMGGMNMGSQNEEEDEMMNSPSTGGMADMMKNMVTNMNASRKASHMPQQKTTTIERLKAKARAKQEMELAKRLEGEAAKINKQREYEVYMAENPTIMDELCKEAPQDDKISASKKKRMKKKARDAKRKECQNENSQTT